MRFFIRFFSPAKGCSCCRPWGIVLKQSSYICCRRLRMSSPPVLPPGASAGEQPCPSMSTLLASDDVGPSMLSIPAFLSPAECAAWVSWGETSGFEQEKHAQTRYIAHRDNGRLAVQSESIAAALWSRLAPLMPAESTRRGAVACGCNPNIRLYRYTPGQRFGQHVDQSNAMPGGEQTEWTMLVYLSGGPGQEVVGGETAFYDGGRRSVVVDPLAGSALLHAHGLRTHLRPSHSSTLPIRRRLSPCRRALPDPRGTGGAAWRQVRAPLRRRLCALVGKPKRGRRGGEGAGRPAGKAQTAVAEAQGNEYGKG